MYNKSVKVYRFFNKRTSLKKNTDLNLREKAKRIDHSLKG